MRFPPGLCRSCRRNSRRTGQGNDRHGFDRHGVAPGKRSLSGAERRHEKSLRKSSLAIPCGSLLPFSLVADRGPCDDKREAKEMTAQAFEILCPYDLPADAGCDAERVHESCRDQWGVKSFIPGHAPRGRNGGRQISVSDDGRKIEVQ